MNEFPPCEKARILPFQRAILGLDVAAPGAPVVGLVGDLRREPDIIIDEVAYAPDDIARAAVGLPPRNAIEVTAIAERPISHDEKIAKLIKKAGRHFTNVDEANSEERRLTKLAHESEDKAKRCRDLARAEMEMALSVVQELRTFGVT